MKPGIESLKKAVITDCKKGQDCFNENGCNQKETVKCLHKYCDKYKWVIDRAKHYAEFCNASYLDIMHEWESARSYWYMNFYQDPNQPEFTGDMEVIHFDAWASQLKSRFGEDRDNWSFKCPACGHAQSMGDFTQIDVDKNNAYTNCIGRYKDDIGCDWSINGLLSIQKVMVVKDSVPHPVFEMADL
ncbi:MAG: VVA0879 family protein [Methylococcales bacterium]